MDSGTVSDAETSGGSHPWLVLLPGFGRSVIGPGVGAYDLGLDWCEDGPLVLDLDFRLIIGSFGWLGVVDSFLGCHVFQILSCIQ